MKMKINPGPETPAKKAVVKKPIPKAAPKKEYDSYIDFFKGNNTYKKGTKSVKAKK